MNTLSKRFAMTFIPVVALVTAAVAGNVSTVRSASETAANNIVKGYGHGLGIEALRSQFLDPKQSPPDDQALSSVQAVSECSPAYTFTGEAVGDVFGWRARSAGDVNNDGYNDVIVGALGNDEAGDRAGKAYVYSGEDGTLLYTLFGEAALDRFGFSVGSAGDVNQDGYGDMIVGAWTSNAGGANSGRAYVFLGGPGPFPITVLAANAAHIFTGSARLRLGASVGSIDDLDGDGVPDLLVGGGNFVTPDISELRLYSGQSFGLIHTFSVGELEDGFGYSSRAAGDVNNDGVVDIIVGALLSDAGGLDAGRAFVYSGQSPFSLMYTVTGETGDALGGMVSGAGDVNNDGFDDFIVGAPWSPAGGTFSGRAFVFLGGPGPFPINLATTDAHYTYTGTTDQLLGWSVSGAGDQDGDGFDDFVIGVPTFETVNARVYLHSGIDGSVIQLFSEGNADWYGRDAFAGADLNADGVNDLIVGAFGKENATVYPGRAYVYLLGDADGDTLVASCDNCPNDFNPGQEDFDGDGVGDACCCVGIKGDANGDGDDANILDLTFLVDYIFRSSGNPGGCPNESDANSDNGIQSSKLPNILDLTYLVDYKFRGGPPPGPC